MKYLLFIIINVCMFCKIANAKKDSLPYIVTTKGDSIILHKKAYIQFYKHPQRIQNRNQYGRKYYISLDTMALLRMDAYDASFVYVKGINNYVAFDIALKKEDKCKHLGYELYREETAVIYTTPHCPNCEGTILYFKEGNELAYPISKTNFREVIRKHFKGSETLAVFANQKRYKVDKLFKLLLK